VQKTSAVWNKYEIERTIQRALQNLKLKKLLNLNMYNKMLS
jgi:hypothetical protein